MNVQLARCLLRRASIPAGRALMGRAAPSLLFRLAVAPTPATRHFSSLSGLLSRELAEEEENGSTEKPAELEELEALVSKDWTIMDDKDTGTVKMFRKSGSTKVAVVFHCQDTMEIDYDEEGEETAPEVRFVLTVTKAGKTMVLNCISVEAKAVVEAVATTTEPVEEIHADGKVKDKLYQGPQFDDLAEDLQDGFHAFVEQDCGIDTNVAAFISMYADYKEEEGYVRWIKQVKSILD